MDENGGKLWIKNIWQRRPGALRNPQSLLVWDMFRFHLTDNTKKLLTECNTDIAVIPGGLTSLVQPLDVCINKPFKQNLKRQWNIWMLEGEKSFTKGGQMRHASLEIVISNSLDDPEDDYLFMEKSNSDGENDTDFDDVPKDITEDEYADLFMLSNNESHKSKSVCGTPSLSLFKHLVSHGHSPSIPLISCPSAVYSGSLSGRIGRALSCRRIVARDSEDWVHHKSNMRAIGDGSHNFEPLSSSEDDTRAGTLLYKPPHYINERKLRPNRFKVSQLLYTLGLQ
ncbi:DDE-1 domain-containing protein [Trichonephila clavipes]|nr:DDE-1 domain-containing protein [Trichonephila clavipes]